MGYDDRRGGNYDRYGQGRGREGAYRAGPGRDRSPDYDRGGRPSDYDYEERGFLDRAGDEVRSWFGDEEAERRRRYDERYDARYGDEGGRDRERGYGRDYGAQSSGRDRGGYRAGGPSGSGSYGASWNDQSGRSRSEGDRGLGVYSAGRSSGRGTEQGQGQGQGPGDDHYRSWRDRQMDAFDRDYEDYRRENQSRFESEFSNYRTRRQSQRQLLEQVKEHAEVLGSDGQHVGTVDHVRGDRIKLTKTDQSAGGHHHSIPSSWLETVEEGRVTISKTAAEAQRLWREEQDNNEQQRRGGLFGGSGDDQTSRDNDSDWSGGRNLNRSFSGTY